MYYKLKILLKKIRSHFKKTMLRIDTTEKLINSILFGVLAVMSWYLTFRFMEYVHVLSFVINTIVWFIVWYGCIVGSLED